MKLYGENHFKLASIYGDIGIVYIEHGNLELALEM
jgi:hypothetical protein